MPIRRIRIERPGKWLSLGVSPHDIDQREFGFNALNHVAFDAADCVGSSILGRVSTYPEACSALTADKLRRANVRPDQFFDESQFESYRRLGLHVIEEIGGVSRQRAATFALAEF